MRSTRACSPHFSCVWKPTRLKWSPASLSWRSCTTAYGNRPVRGSVKPDRLHRTEAQRVADRDAPSPRWAGTLRRTSPCRSRARSPTRPRRGRRRTRRTRPSSSGNSDSRPGRRPPAADRAARALTMPAGDPRAGCVPTARRGTPSAAIDGLGQDDRADRVVERQVFGADEGADVRRQRVGRERTGGDDDRRPAGRRRWGARPPPRASR